MIKSGPNSEGKNQVNEAEKDQIKMNSKNTVRSHAGGKQTANMRQLVHRDNQDNLAKTGIRVGFKYTGETNQTIIKV